MGVTKDTAIDCRNAIERLASVVERMRSANLVSEQFGDLIDQAEVEIGTIAECYLED